MRKEPDRWPGTVVATSSCMDTAPLIPGASDPGHPGAKARRAAIAVVAACGMLAVAWLAYKRWGGDEAVYDYVTVEAARRDIASHVTATGTLSPVVQVQVGSLVSGRIKELYADYNSEVKVGQVIATIDPQLFETDMAQARARLSSAESELLRVEAIHAGTLLEFERLTRLASSGDVALADLDSARADWLAAKAQSKGARSVIAQARASLDQSAVNLAYTTIRSPIDGIVVSRNVDVGQVVAASLQAPTLFVIAEELRNMEVHTSVAESDVGQLAAGTGAEFFVDAYPGQAFEGVVKQVRYEAVTVSNVVTYDALIAVRNDELKLRPGMTANVNIVVDEHHEVLVIPNRALRYQPSDPRLRNEQQAPATRRGGEAGVAVGKTVSARAGTPSLEATAATRQELLPSNPGHRLRRVWRLKAGIPEAVDIVVGLSDGTDTEVVQGALQEADRIIIAEGRDNERAGASSQRHGPPRVF